MASEKPSQRSKIPSPLARPRTKPLDTKSRKFGEVSRSGLSVQRGVQGRMISSTPSVAHTVTNSRERRRSSHISTVVGFRRTARIDGRGESLGMECASRDVVGGGVVGSTLNTHPAPWPRHGRLFQIHLGILRPEGLDALGNVAVIDVAAVDLEEIGERGRIVAGTLERGSELVMQRGASFLLQVGKLQGLFVPADRNFGHSFFKEALGQPGISLHQVGESVAAVDELAYFLQLTDSFVEQAHFAERDTQVVVRLWIFVRACGIVFQ